MKYAAITNEIIKQGVDNFNFSALPHHLKAEILTETGDLLFKNNHHSEAGKAFNIAQNEQKLQDCARFLEQQGLIVQAAAYLQYSNDKEKVDNLAIKVLDQGKTEIALTLFEKSQNQEMINFVRQNF
tara:strand:- start:158 stop:538 length:381 start_codon:yes stop_codon:yes gene_type:complete